MGDRANIAIQYHYVGRNNGPDGQDAETRSRIYFYGHWSGEDYAAAVQRALSKRWRWTHDAYLARIIFDEFVPASMRGQETGFGIAPFVCDNEHPVLVVDIGAQAVIVENEEPTSG